MAKEVNGTKTQEPIMMKKTSTERIYSQSKSYVALIPDSFQALPHISYMSPLFFSDSSKSVCYYFRRMCIQIRISVLTFFLAGVLA